MSYTDYEYGGMMAGFWDLLRGDTSQWPDRFFFKDVMAQASQLYADAGFTDLRLTSEFTHDPAKPDDVIFCIAGTRP